MRKEKPQMQDERAVSIDMSNGQAANEEQLQAKLKIIKQYSQIDSLMCADSKRDHERRQGFGHLERLAVPTGPTSSSTSCKRIH
jgi:hypothetical protein